TGFYYRLRSQDFEHRMQGQVQNNSGLKLQLPQSTFMLATVRMKVQQPHNYTFSMDATTPPATDNSTVMQRGDAVNMVLSMLSDLQTSTVILTGDAGVGKST